MTKGLCDEVENVSVEKLRLIDLTVSRVMELAQNRGGELGLDTDGARILAMCAFERLLASMFIDCPDALDATVELLKQRVKRDLNALGTSLN